MTRTRYRFCEAESEYPCFMTCTIVAWQPVFTRPETFQIIYDSWKHLQREKEFKLLAYVILENHLHLIASAPQLAKAMQAFKGFTAHEIIRTLEEHHADLLLRQFEFFKLKHKTKSQHQVWQESSHPQQLRTEEAMWQKVEYIHMNPLKRGFVNDPVHWQHSSARNYAGQSGLIDVITDWR
jgi:putative transposase